MNGFVKLTSCVPTVHIAEPDKNAEEILQMLQKADGDILVFPELCVTGYTCADLFFQTALLAAAERAVLQVAEATRDSVSGVVVIGAPLVCDNRIFNCAIVMQDGKILGVVPKSYLPNYNEFYERRWFAGASERVSDTIRIGTQRVPFSDRLLFRDEENDVCIGVDVCEDLWVPIPPSSYHCIAGANIIVNLSASNDIVSKARYRRDLVAMQSAKCFAAYIYTSASSSESTTDLVMSGHSLICENGRVVSESRFREGVFSGLVDVEKLRHERLLFNTFMDKALLEGKQYTVIPFSMNIPERLPETVDAYPFVPGKKEERFERCREILNLQSEGLAQRMRKTGILKAAVNISGGLDSTLALIVIYEAIKKLGIGSENIIGITLPGFGTSERTYRNSLQLMERFGVTQRDIDIKEACEVHLRDIGHGEDLDITYENTQARERTQILMDIANQEGALAIGTGDLSELALGWCTYNGDHMSMYAVNTSIPKTLVRYIVEVYAEMNENVREVLLDICDTPISPELLPTDSSGNIAQKTESVIGKYDIHDFVLYHFMRSGYSFEKIYRLAQIAFKGLADDQELRGTMETFYRRFFSQQFKRSCLPDGPKVGSVCLSPRGDWRMPSDAKFGF